MNEKALRYILRRDFSDGCAPTCLFCNQPLKVDKNGRRSSNEPEKVVLDHLNNNSKNDNYWNMALVHQKCNQDKRTNGDYQIIAHDKIAENKKYVPSPSEGGSDQHDNANVKTGNKLHALTKKYLERKLPYATTPAILVSDVCDELAYLAQEKYHCGSQPTMKRHLESLCSNSAPWEINYGYGGPVVSRRLPSLAKLERARRRRKAARMASRRTNTNDQGPSDNGAGGVGGVGNADPQGPKDPVKVAQVERGTSTPPAIHPSHS